MISPKTAAVGRKRTNFDRMPGRFPKGTFDRIDAVLEPGETRASFLREAVEDKLRARQRNKRDKDESPKQ